MSPLLELLFALLLVRLALGQEQPYDDYYDDAPFGLIGGIVIWAVMFAVFVLWCVLIGLSIAFGLALIAGLLFLFGAGGVVTSLIGFATTRKPRVGWRILSVWLHAGCLLAAGAAFGGLAVPMFWNGLDAWTCAGLGALAGLATGITVGWLFAVAVERFLGMLKGFASRRLKRTPSHE
jgi:hypothetical protein